MTDPMMNVALSLAEGTAGQTSPNPPVGAVVVKDGRILGTGAHLKAGGPHAEVHALLEAGAEAEGADLYVTLEPCNHTGRTPPCTRRIIENGIRRVFIGAQDPNPSVTGEGGQMLREAGIEVIDMPSNRADSLIRPFAHYIRTSTPFTTIKSAVSADGRTAAYTGHSHWITSDAAREDVHRLRSRHDAVLTGIGTVLQDNPLLTSRLPRGGKHPIRVILDTDLRTPVQSHVIQNRDAETIIICGSEAPVASEHALRQMSVEVLRMTEPEIRIPELLRCLGKRGIMTLLVEAGGEVNASFIESRSFQELIIYIAPKLIGGALSPSLFGGMGFASMDESLPLRFHAVEQLGPDLKITASPQGGSPYVHRDR